MVLPAPNLDDRRFQDLVDDAKRLVQRNTTYWTDHNVSDPGVTLIEAFAWMTDQLLYRLNRVPDRHYIKFLELIGVRLYPPAAAHAPVTFWLSAPQPATVTIPAGTEVATVRTGNQPPVVFSTTEDRAIVACSLARVASTLDGKEVSDLTDGMSRKSGVFPFSSPPKPGEVLLVGLSDAVPGCAVNLRFTCRIEGIGVDPDDPPLAWEAWTGDDWSACELERDTTGGINRDGDVVLHVPRGHAVSTIEKLKAGWLRARVTDPRPGQPPYSASPEIRGLTAFTIGGTADAMNAELILKEVVGESEGVPAGRFQLRRAPVVAGEKPLVVEVREGDDWQEWTQAPSFAASGPDDRRFVLDAASGQIEFGPAVRLADGTLRTYGAVPPIGATIRVPQYRSGGGAGGNVAAGALSVLKASIPYVTRVENRRAAFGGVDGEDLEMAKVRGPITLRTRDRAVTAEDFEHIAREVAPEVARVRAITGDANEPGVVRVLIVPAVPGSNGRLTFDALVPGDDTLARIAKRLDESRLVGTRVVVEPPAYRGLTIVARLKARPGTDANRLQQEALDALFRYFHPTTGGPDGGGWPFGRPVLAGEVFAALQAVRGTELVEDVRVFGADPVTGERGKPTDRLEVDGNALVFSYDHQVVVDA
ncbi:MAG TPA: putative baseplate assembly protein [Candidatus Limnocylindrales bacterium]|nr:putative baseplate assembly protein [Candidatus Limnocylindrales bacterium]